MGPSSILLKILWRKTDPLRFSMEPSARGAVVKKSGVEPSMLKHTGPAVVFDSEEDVRRFLR